MSVDRVQCQPFNFACETCCQWVAPFQGVPWGLCKLGSSHAVDTGRRASTAIGYALKGRHAFMRCKAQHYCNQWQAKECKHD